MLLIMATVQESIMATGADGTNGVGGGSEIDLKPCWPKCLSGMISPARTPYESLKCCTMHRVRLCGKKQLQVSTGVTGASRTNCHGFSMLVM